MRTIQLHIAQIGISQVCELQIETTQVPGGNPKDNVSCVDIVYSNQLIAPGAVKGSLLLCIGKLSR